MRPDLDAEVRGVREGEGGRGRAREGEGGSGGEGGEWGGGGEEGGRSGDGTCNDDDELGRQQQTATDNDSYVQ